MKKLLLILTMVFLMFSAFTACRKKTTGCHNSAATNYEPNTEQSCSSCCDIPKPKGSLLIWTNMEDMSEWGTGSFYVNIDNTGLKLINRYYLTPPANCKDQNGFYYPGGSDQGIITQYKFDEGVGFYHLEEGEHSCQIYRSDGKTLLQEGTITVKGKECNMMQLHRIGDGVDWIKRWRK